MSVIHPDKTTAPEPIDVLGPMIEFLTSASHQDAYCVLRGTLPPGVAVPLHSHPDPESFLVVSGNAEALLERDNRLDWVGVKTGDFVHIPGGVRHAHRNRSSEPVIELVVTTPALGRFLQEIGRPIDPDRAPRPPTREQLERLERIAAKYGHWLATSAENLAVGISV
jgi:quercetin dioxygenase-like cupin family protein